MSTGDPLLGPGFRRRLRNTHQWNFFSVGAHQTDQHRWKLSFCLHVALLSCQSPVNHCRGATTNHVPPPGGPGCEDQRTRAGRGVGTQRGQVWAESVSGGETTGETLHSWRGAAGQGDEEATHRGGKWQLHNVSAVTTKTHQLCYCDSRLSVCVDKVIVSNRNLGARTDSILFIFLSNSHLMS